MAVPVSFNPAQTETFKQPENSRLKAYERLCLEKRTTSMTTSAVFAYLRHRRATSMVWVSIYNYIVLYIVGMK